MSETPIFEKTLAEYVAAGLGVPFISLPAEAKETLQEALIRIGHVRALALSAPPLQPAFTDWTAITRGVTP